MSTVIHSPLSPDQEALLAPLIRQASAVRHNILFVATAVPHDGTWHLPVMNIPASTGAKLRRLINTGGGT